MPDLAGICSRFLLPESTTFVERCTIEEASTLKPLCFEEAGLEVRMKKLLLSAATGAFLLGGAAIATPKNRGAAWVAVPTSSRVVQASPIVPRLKSFSAYQVDTSALAAKLALAPVDEGEGWSGFPVTIELPRPDGRLERFSAVEQPIFAKSVRANYPGIKTYIVQGIEDPTRSGRISLTPLGFHGIVLGGDGAYYIDPVSRVQKNTVTSYFKNQLAPKDSGWSCYTIGSDMGGGDHEYDAGGGDSGYSLLNVGTNLRTYRMVVNGTIEYTAFHGGTATLGNAAIAVSVNRINAIYERDIAIRFNLVLARAFVGSDSFTNSNGGAMLSQNQTVCDANPGNANYDIGHVFSTGGGGVAYLNGILNNSLKAGGVTGQPEPINDAFDIDYVAHEVGHQVGGNHSFNGTAGACSGGNRNPSTAWEPGSASTIMGYAGICGTQDLQPNSDAVFHVGNLLEIISTRNVAIGTLTNNGNTLPIIGSLTNYTIPQGTPFRLNASATDANGDALTYFWEQLDPGTPLFRSFVPTANTWRTFPQQSSLLNGTFTSLGETLATTNRAMNFRVSVRDNRAGGGGNVFGSVVVNTLGAAFNVTSQTSNVTYQAGSVQNVTWALGGSTATNVKIFLSTTGGSNFGSRTGLIDLGTFSNTGTAAVTIPWVGNISAQARLLVEPVGNIYFDINTANFTLNESNNVTLVVPSSIKSGATVNGTLNLTAPAPAGGLTFTMTDTSTNVTLPASVTIPATATSVSFPISTVVIASNQAVGVTAARTGYNKSGSFTLTANSAPSAVNDNYSTPFETSLVINAPGVLGNDTDAQSDTLTASIVTPPSSGSLTLNPNGSFTYTPASGFSGNVTFTYRANDGAVDSGLGTVTINVQPPKTLSGTVTLDQLDSPGGPAAETIEIRLKNAGVTVNTFTTTLNASGGYSVNIPSGVTGNLEVVIKSSHWLAKSAGVKSFNSSATATVTLINGDVDGDNSVTIFDYIDLSSNFDVVGTNVPGDLDEDGQVTIFDYIILSDSFDKFGDNW